MKRKNHIQKGVLTIIGIVLAILFVSPVLLLVNSSFKTLRRFILIYWLYRKSFHLITIFRRLSRWIFYRPL